MSDTELRYTLKNLPRDLAGTYRRILHKISCFTNGKEKVKLARRAFRWIMCAKRPLTIEELAEAVVLRENDKSFPTHRIPTDGGTRLRLACGNLVVFDEEHRLVRLAHHTVQQFITEWYEDDVVTDDDLVHSSVRFTLDEAEFQIYTLCLTYLCFSDFETQITRRDSNTPKISESGGFVPSLINYMLPDSGTVGRLTALLKGQATSTSINKWNLSIQGNGSSANQKSDLKRKYHLLDYVSIWWCFHLPSTLAESFQLPLSDYALTPQYRGLGPKTRRVCEKDFPFPHRPWDDDILGDGSQSLTVPDIPMFRWAARSGKFGFWTLRNYGIWDQSDSDVTDVDVMRYFHDAILYDNEQRDLLADILDSGSESGLEFYFSAVRAHTIGPAIPAWIICRAMRLSSKSRHAMLFTGLKTAEFVVARGQPEKPFFWRRGSMSTLWLDSTWSATNTSGFDDAAGTFLLEEAVKQNDADIVRCILENDVGEVQYFGPFHTSQDDSPLGRAAYGDNITMVDILFSYFDSTEWGAKIRKFNRGDLDEGLRKRSLWRMKEHVEALSRSSRRFNEGNEALPQIRTSW